MWLAERRTADQCGVLSVGNSFMQVSLCFSPSVSINSAQLRDCPLRA